MQSFKFICIVFVLQVYNVEIYKPIYKQTNLRPLLLTDQQTLYTTLLDKDITRENL